ncbi:MAG: SUF system Fe-S cluster assembly regulator [Planctomycetota bacterium]
MFRLSKLADYGIVLLACFARDACGEQGCTSATDLAETTSLPLPTVSKILKLLGKAGVLESIRGARGGYKLSRPPEEIALTDVIVALDGPIAMTECCQAAGNCGCDIEAGCPVRINWQRINTAVHAALSSVSLAEMILDQPPGLVQQASARFGAISALHAHTIHPDAD